MQFGPEDDELEDDFDEDSWGEEDFDLEDDEDGYTGYLDEEE